MNLRNIVFFTLVFLCQPPLAFGASFVVGSNLNLADQVPGDGICQTALGSPHNCTLKAAIEEANAHPGSDTITFNAPLVFSGILPLPEITDGGLIIDASNQWDTTTNAPGIEIIAGGGDVGLLIKNSNTVIQGILFTGGGTGIHVLAGGDNRIGGPGTHERNVFLTAGLNSYGVFIDQYSISTVVQYNYFGHRNGEPFGADDFYLGYRGIHVFGSDVGSGTVIEHNVIGEQSSAGIFLEWCGAVKVRNNLIGKPLAGSNAKIPNAVGILVSGTTAVITDNTVAANVQGQIVSGQGGSAGSPDIVNNRIGSPYEQYNASAPAADGIKLGLNGNHSNVTGNIIENTNGYGLSITCHDVATATVENNDISNNKQDGAVISCQTIGTVVSGNTIYENKGNGIVLNSSRYVAVSGNWIGFVSKAFDGGNSLAGIRVENLSTDNLIGGIGPTAANYIGHNKTSGIYITGAGTRDNYVAGNIIGSGMKTVTGYIKAGNGHHGIAVYDNAEANKIGLSGSLLSPNLILDSAWRGIAVINSNHNEIIGNKVGTDGGARNWGNTYSGIHVIGNNNIMKSNTIAYNGFGPVPAQAGIVVQGGTSFGNQISENLIYNNGAAGIDLVDGGNQDIQAPLLQRTGNTLSGTSYPSARIEFFSGSDKDEGRWFEGSVLADSTGAFTWQKQGHFHGAFVIATTTVLPAQSTSEFSSHVEGYVFPWTMFLPATLSNGK